MGTKMGMERGRKMKKVATSGYFDPLHVGHLEYIKLAKELGDHLIVIVNNDAQCELKKGRAFMNEHDRVEIVRSLKLVDEVFLSIDVACQLDIEFENVSILSFG